MFDTTKTGPFCTETIEATAIEYLYCEHDLNEPVAAQLELIPAPATTKEEESHLELARRYGALGRMVRERRRQRNRQLRATIGSFLEAHKQTGTARDTSLTYENIGDDTEQKDALLLEELSVR